MTAAFWWYVLAGFLVGFCVSTAWEWLYYRQRRMRITDRRIAELQQALRAQAREAPAVEVLPQADVTWSATEYRSPGVFMETEAKGEHAEAEPTAQETSSGELAAGAAAVVATAAVIAEAVMTPTAPENVDLEGAPAAAPDGRADELAKAAAVLAVADAALASEDELGVTTASAPVEEDFTADVTAASGAAEQATMDDGGADLAQAAVAGAALAAASAEDSTAAAVKEDSTAPFTEKAWFAVKQAWEKARASIDILRSA